MKGRMVAALAAALAGLAVSGLAAQETPVEPLLAGTKLRFGGQLRARGESNNIQSYAASGLRRGQDLGLLRTRVNVEALPAAGVRVFAQLQDSRTAGSEASVASNEKNLDLRQGYLDLPELWEWPVLLRVGRQELSYGDGRMISPLDWSNIGRAWDGVRLSGGPAQWRADLFVTKIKEVAGFKRDAWFSGLYGSCEAVPEHEFDAYMLFRDQGDGTLTAESGRKGNLAERTAGSRIRGKIGGADYSAEAAWQFGRIAGDQIRSYAGAATAGYTFETAWKPRVGIELDHGSGDKDPNDARRGAFEPLFPFAHIYQGQQDIFSWKNGEDWVFTTRAEPGGGWQLQADYHWFRLAHGRDGWYDALGGLIRRDATGASGRKVGHEIDLTARVMLRKAVKLWFGVSRFWNSSYVKGTGGGGDRNWGFFQATVDF
ncbi:MAG: alginate export family protein [Elusimicrobia bacterium]|nr:alginate export family protein [Elusimicrobiota bacterium]